MLCPVPCVQLTEQRALNIPALTHSEVGFNDIRNDDPCAHIIEPVCRLCHRAEVYVDVAKRLLHALVNADTLNWNNCLPTEDEFDIRS